MVRPNNNQNNNNDNEVLISTDEYLQLGVDLQEALDTRRELADVEYHSMELAWALSNTDIAPLVGGVKDIVEYANDFDPTMQNGKIVASDIYDDDEQMTPEEVAQLDKDTISNDAYSRWEHLA
tara:strand:- start:6908 stop:7276 length:369 start_codon:yes stop_codon:yes gene_type:complete